MKPGRFAAALLLLAIPALAQGPVGASPLAADIDRRATAIEQEMLAWRRHLHQHPELSNREQKTAAYIAERLRSFGLKPVTGIARHGVVAVLRGARPGPVVALRADMDALPVTEATGLPFASTATADYEGRRVGVMHACGHDTHMAMLLAAARILTDLRPQLRGTVTFIFQPAEEGAPRDEQPAGAEAMVREGVLKNPDVDAIFGIHVVANLPSGVLGWRSGPMLASADAYEIVVRGRQTHGANPWSGIDPIVVGSQIVMALQTIVSRQVNIADQPVVVSVGQFEAGTRNNIIPETARLVGTIRTFDEAMRADIHDRVAHTARSIAAAAGATADVRIDRGYPVTVNDPRLIERMLPALRRIAGGRVQEVPRNMVAEDFSYYQREVPGMFLFLGITPPDQVGRAPANHSPQFTVDESALLTGVRALAHLAADYLSAGH